MTPSRAAATVPARVAGTYVNPILDGDFPDPAVILAPDGLYYAYATQTLRDGEWVNIQVARSADLLHWQQLGDALPEKPSWASETQDFWAPYVLYDGEQFVMYYSATPDACHTHERGHALAVATSNSPAGPFVDMGMPLLLGVGFEYIDPMVFIDPASGQWLLYWGSGFHPIRVQELGEDRMSFAPGSEATNLIWPNPDGFPALVKKLIALESEPLALEADVKTMKTPTLIIAGDADVATLDHYAAWFHLLGGGDMGDMGKPLSSSRIAILPATSHTAVITQVALLQALIEPFLKGQTPKGFF